MPFRQGCVPVKIDARVGEHTGWAHAWLKYRPLRRNRLIFGSSPTMSTPSLVTTWTFRLAPAPVTWMTSLPTSSRIQRQIFGWPLTDMFVAPYFRTTQFDEETGHVSSAHLLSGNANTYSACPLCGILMSGAIAAGTLRGLPPPRPDMMPMYWRPSISKLTGNP